MSIFKTLQNLFFPACNTDKFSPIPEERKRRFEIKFNELGKVISEDDGFILENKSAQQKIRWADIERLIAYKKDLMTTDEICLDIIFDSRQLTINEGTPGWDQFVEKTKLAFPGIPKNWDTEITKPAFATNLTILFQR